jgi:hypothetical protein
MYFFSLRRAGAATMNTPPHVCVRTRNATCNDTADYYTGRQHVVCPLIHRLLSPLDLYYGRNVALARHNMQRSVPHARRNRSANDTAPRSRHIHFIYEECKIEQSHTC